MPLKPVQRLRLTYGWGHRLQDLAAYGVTGGARSAADAEGYLSYHAMKDLVRPALNSSAGAVLANNKWVFYKLFDGFGFPLPRTLGLFDPVHGSSWDGLRPLQSAEQVVAEVHRCRPDGLVLKPAGGSQGRGLVILDELDHDTGRARTRTGEETTLADALEGLDPGGAGGFPGHLVQEPLRSHPELAALAPWTTNTLRVVTIVTADGEGHVQGAVTTLGRRGRMANNWHQGGVNVTVDVASGVLGRGVVLEPLRWTDRHPDTDERFVGVRVPWWDEVIDVCLRAARLLPGARSIGWDVVVTQDGPVLLEANTGWDVRHLQIHGDGFLADPETWGRFEAAGAPRPTGGLRSTTPRRLAQQVRGRARVLSRR